MTTPELYTIVLSVGELDHDELTGSRILQEMRRHSDCPEFRIIIEGRGRQRPITSGPSPLDEI